MVGRELRVEWQWCSLWWSWETNSLEKKQQVLWGARSGRVWLILGAERFSPCLRFCIHLLHANVHCWIYLSFSSAHMCFLRCHFFDLREEHQTLTFGLVLGSHKHLDINTVNG